MSCTIFELLDLENITTLSLDLRSLNVIGCYTIRYIVYNILLAFHSNYC